MATFSKISEGVTVMDDDNSGTGWVLIGTNVASSASTSTITGLDSTYDHYALVVSALTTSNDNIQVNFRLGDSGGIDSASNDYDWHISRTSSTANTYLGNSDTATGTAIPMVANIGNGTSEGGGCIGYLAQPGDSGLFPQIHGTYSCTNNSGLSEGGAFCGQRNSAIVTTQVQIWANFGTFSCRFSVYGIPHS